MHVTAAVPYVRDMINSGHNVCVKKTYYKLHCYDSITSFTVARQQVRIFSNSVSNTVLLCNSINNTAAKNVGHQEQQQGDDALKPALLPLT